MSRPRRASISRLLATAAAGHRRISGVVHELIGAATATADRASRRRLVTDVVLFRVLRVWPRLAARAGSRDIQARGARITYRLNRGDIQSIREVWFDRIYRMPPPHSFEVLVDLGTNIGLTSLWLRHEYGVEYVIGVEPDPANAAMARRNFAANGVRGHVVHAAIGPHDGSATFAARKGASNLGRLSVAGQVVRQISMSTVLAHLEPGQHVDLLKLDIEGAEQELILADNLDWLDRVDAIIAEFHPDRVDVARLIETLKQEGFEHSPAGSLWPGSMDIFRKCSKT